MVIKNNYGKMRADNDLMPVSLSIGNEVNISLKSPATQGQHITPSPQGRFQVKEAQLNKITG